MNYNRNATTKEMSDSPSTLQDICLKNIGENKKFLVKAFLQVLHINSSLSLDESSNLCFEPQNFIPCNVSQNLLYSSSCYGNADDEVLELFNANVTRLERVKLRTGSYLTPKGLKILKQHNILSLEIPNLLKVPINNLIACLNEWTLKNLYELRVPNCTFASNGRFSVIVVLSKLRNLRSLNISNTKFTTHGLEIIVEDLPFLESLNISKTKISDISPLKKCKTRLRSLSMYNLSTSANSDFIPVIWNLYNLEYLDISEDVINPLESLTLVRSKVGNLFESPECLPKLAYLDVSGRDGFTSDDLRTFMRCHPRLAFLGLVYSDMCAEDFLTNPCDKEFNANLKVAGCSNEHQILKALLRYLDRPHYVQKLLYVLYTQTNKFTVPRIDVIQLIIRGMKIHSVNLGIQMSGTACLYNLSRGKIGQRIHPKWFQEIVTVTLKAMEKFSTNKQLQKNALLTLCSDRILQDIIFDRYHCAKLVMDTLVLFEDLSMNKMAVAICSILAAKISTTEIAAIGADPSYMERLLSLVRNQTPIIGEAVDTTMVKFTLSALWNLTDESPKTCESFLRLGGLELMLELLNTFPGESSIETKVLGIMNNIVEVSELRVDVLQDDFILALRDLLHSSHIDVGYFSAGIVAHLSCDNVETWNSLNVSRSDLLFDLSQAVCSWEMPETEMVAYRSFRPFFPLLEAENFEIQLWALWAVHHVCSKNSKRYCSMLREENGVEKIASIIQKTSDVPVPISNLCQRILQIVEEDILT